MTVLEFITMLTTTAGATIELRAEPPATGRTEPWWHLTIMGMPPHIGEIRISGPSAEGCVRDARTQMSQRISRKIQTMRVDHPCGTPTKVRFPNALEACEALMSIMKTNAARGEKGPISFYECKPGRPGGGCGGWHLTSHPQQEGGASDS